MKKLLLSIFTTFILFGSFANVFATDLPMTDADHVHEPEVCDQKHIEVFVRNGCGFCAKEKEFLKTIQDETVCHVKFLDIYENKDLYNKITEKFNLSRVTPITLVGDEIIVGFNEANAEKIKEIMNTADIFYTFDGILKQKAHVNQLDKVKFFGWEFNVNELKQKSMTLLAVILGFIDGFNPCAMWVLVMFLVALAQMADRTKMFIMAGTFIFAEAVMYGLILTVWITAFNYAGFERWVTLSVGIVALGAGGFFLYEGIFSDGTCKVTNPEQRKKINTKINDLAKKPLNWGFIIGILILAFSVNIIEFACSAGIPQTFALIISTLPIIKQIWLGFIYIIFYMLDDMIVFAIALWSIEKIGITHKYAKISNVIGGVLILAIGLILLFVPKLISSAAG